MQSSAIPEYAQTSIDCGVPLLSSESEYVDVLSLRIPSCCGLRSFAGWDLAGLRFEPCSPDAYSRVPASASCTGARKWPT